MPTPAKLPCPVNPAHGEVPYVYNDQKKVGSTHCPQCGERGGVTYAEPPAPEA